MTLLELKIQPSLNSILVPAHVRNSNSSNVSGAGAVATASNAVGDTIGGGLSVAGSGAASSGGEASIGTGGAPLAGTGGEVSLPTASSSTVPPVATA